MTNDERFEKLVHELTRSQLIFKYEFGFGDTDDVITIGDYKIIFNEDTIVITKDCLSITLINTFLINCFEESIEFHTVTSIVKLDFRNI